MTVYDKINIMLPTYGRAGGQLKEFIDSAIDKADNKKRLCFTFMLHEGDSKSEAVCRMVPNSKILWENEPKPNLALYFNRLFDETPFREPGTLVSMLGDDMVFETQGWDTILLEAANWFGGLGLFYGDDVTFMHDTLSVHAFMSREWATSWSPLPWMAPQFPCDDIDVVLYETARATGRLFYLPELKIRHNHANYTGNKDSTHLRLRDRFQETLEARGKGNRARDAYVNSVVENINKNIGVVLDDSRIAVIMTCKDRIDLLNKTCQSMAACQYLPPHVHVFDDASEKLSAVREAVSLIPGAILHDDMPHIGVNRKTPVAMEWAFSNLDPEAVLVIDSDSLFAQHWWPRAQQILDVAKEPGVGCVSLYNGNNGDPEPFDAIPGLVQKRTNGAFGTLYTREFWKSYILPLKQSGYGEWDNMACVRSAKDKLKTLACSPSFLQHTGIHEGVHVSPVDQSTMALDFVGSSSVFKEFSRSDKAADSKALLLCCMGRHGDCLMVSAFAKMLRKAGFNVTWLTIPYYEATVRCVWDGPLITKKVEGHLDWFSTSTMMMNKEHPGFAYYVNAQPGSPEHHDSLLNSGISTVAYVREVISVAIGASLQGVIKEYMGFVRLPDAVVQSRNDKPLCIICPGALSHKGAIDDAKAIELRHQYSREYDARILMEKRPQGLSWREIRYTHLFDYTFQQCLALVSKCDLYIGNDSAFAWASLASNGKKIIYHTNDRMRKVNNRFAELDPNATDVII